MQNSEDRSSGTPISAPSAARCSPLPAAASPLRRAKLTLVKSSVTAALSPEEPGLVLEVTSLDACVVLLKVLVELSVGAVVTAHEQRRLARQKKAGRRTGRIFLFIISFL